MWLANRDSGSFSRYKVAGSYLNIPWLPRIMKNNKKWRLYRSQRAQQKWPILLLFLPWITRGSSDGWRFCFSQQVFLMWELVSRECFGPCNAYPFRISETLLPTAKVLLLRNSKFFRDFNAFCWVGECFHAKDYCETRGDIHSGKEKNLLSEKPPEWVAAVKGKDLLCLKLL